MLCRKKNYRWVPLLLTLFTVFATAAPSRKCTIKQVVGTVKIRRGTSTAWRDARPKMPLRQTDAIRTFVESEVEIETSEGTSIKIGENTTMELKTLQGTAEVQKTAVKIMNGAILANVKKLVSTGSTFEFETPTATAAIRGTIVGLEVNKEQTRVKVYEGRVLVTPQGSSNGVELKQNQLGVVERGGDQVAIEKFDEKTPVPLSTSASDTLPDSLHTSTDTTEQQDTTSVKDTTGQSMTTQEKASFSLALQTPSEGGEVTQQTPLSVSGKVTPSTATVSINGKTANVGSDGAFKATVTTPVTTGPFELQVRAEVNGMEKSISRSVIVSASPLLFSVSTPREGQQYIKPVIPVSGTVTPGAEVTVSSIGLQVTGSGSFTGQVPIANEAGEHTLDFEAVLDGSSQKISRRIVYKPEYRFILSSPPDRQTVTSTNIVIKGEVLPVNAEVAVNGRNLSVTSSGQFSGYITIPDEEGEVALEFEVTASGISKTETRTIIYKRPPDIYRPQLSASVAKSCWNITVFDRTVDEEITLWYEIDGNREFTTLRPNESTCISLEDGMHSYRAYAEDRAKNISNSEVLTNYSYLSTTTWLIRMRRPAGSMALDLPPASPGGEPAYYTVEFTIENLPQDDMRLIREIAITNTTTGRRTALRTFTDNFIDADIELVRQRTNIIRIDVNDINNVTKSNTFQITVR